MLSLFELSEKSLELKERCKEIEVVCIGDSNTGWNNYGKFDDWPHQVYPTFLEGIIGKEVANLGIASAQSEMAPGLTNTGIIKFPNSKVFIYGFGTNDFGDYGEMETISNWIIRNLEKACDIARKHGKSCVLFNVPQVKLPKFLPQFQNEIRERRIYHNRNLSEYCKGKGIPLVDVYLENFDNYLGDELHTNDLGAKFIAEKVWEKIKRYVSRQGEEE